MTLINLGKPSDYTFNVRLDDVLPISTDVTLADYIKDLHILTIGETETLRHMYGSMERAGWAILKKVVGGHGVDQTMTGLEVKVKEALTASLTADVPKDDLLASIEEAMWHFDIKVSDINRATNEALRPFREGMDIAITVGLVVGPGLWVSASLIEGNSKKQRAARLGLRLGGLTLIIGSFVTCVVRAK